MMSRETKRRPYRKQDWYSIVHSCWGHIEPFERGLDRNLGIRFGLVHTPSNGVQRLPEPQFKAKYNRFANKKAATIRRTSERALRKRQRHERRRDRKRRRGNTLLRFLSALGVVRRVPGGSFRFWGKTAPVALGFMVILFAPLAGKVLWFLTHRLPADSVKMLAVLVVPAPLFLLVVYLVRPNTQDHQRVGAISLVVGAALAMTHATGGFPYLPFQLNAPMFLFQWLGLVAAIGFFAFWYHELNAPPPRPPSRPSPLPVSRLSPHIQFPGAREPSSYSNTAYLGGSQFIDPEDLARASRDYWGRDSNELWE